VRYGDLVFVWPGNVIDHAHCRSPATTCAVIELDVTNEADLAALESRVREHVDGLDGVVHSIGFAPEAALGGNFLNTQWADVATAMQVSAYSFKSLAMATRPPYLMAALRLSV
jgi:enoyl-[acyl-carrier-protein] reductase (NADH)